ncbi:hypothetical protein G3I76_73425 [Streptomyces sp. SID11233]|nr:hypothetical protein [Streptomyces sp. SID11233]
MTDMTGARDAFKNRCANAARTLASCVGYTVSRISFDAFAEEDSLTFYTAMSDDRASTVRNAP